MRRIASAIFMFSAVVGGWLFSQQPASAWGAFGHLTVCDLAYRNLTDPSRAELKKTFHAGQGGITVHAKDGTELRHYTSFNVGCLEEDETPRKHPADHFVNLDRTTGSILSASCPAGGSCIFAGIDRDLAILKDRSKSDEDRVFALMAIGHWIGDIHQPLHISFADDKGGNAIKARVSGGCGTSSYRPRNLHAVWDGCLLEAGLFQKVRKRADFKASWGRRTITYRAVDTLLANTSLTDEQQMVATAPAIWANESLQITLQPAVQYCVKVASSCNYSNSQASLGEGDEERSVALGNDYLATYAPIAEDRVRKAGFRLAHLINLALDPEYQGPTKDSLQP
ncbi:S1/P1 nuclease [Rhizobium laguerreae]|uniref:S1/P1 nuclease n=1 Tax=Rhizobium laguerreae TaxID=1076926 RepID=UPI00144240B1|nr:S1/P1 nuclease [Rhizobium laguerreae]